MCGIAGIIDATASTSDRELGEQAMRMAMALRHRGPDDAGTWTDAAAGVAFGHTRLAIIDLTAEGHQPMESRDGRYVLVFNGEIYNYRALRRELEGAGERFRGHSDTEVMLAAFVRWGMEAALARFNGMFAFALWDRSTQKLHLVRDRLGEKPLYYGTIGGRFVFGSELKALRSAGAESPSVDRDVVGMLLRYRYVPAPWSIYRGIAKVPPGSIVTAADRGARVLPPVPFWSAREAAEAGIAAPFRGSEDEATEELEHLLLDAVRIRLESDVPLGAFLSGGIDSSTIVALMQRVSDRPIRTFTVGFEDRRFDEASDARAVARHLGTDHTDITLRPEDALSVIPRLPALYDEPFSDSSQIPTFLISEFARRHVTVALSGDGGDELFGGYNRYGWVRPIWRATRGMPASLRRATASALRKPSSQAWDAFFDRAAPLLPTRLRQRNPGLKIHKLSDILGARDAGSMYLSLVSHWKDPSSLVIGAHEPETIVTDRAAWPAMRDVTEQMMFLDAVTYLPDDILAKVDRASMGVGLEVRVPFLDHRVFEYAWRLPLSMKMRNGVGKWIVRRLLHGTVPPELVDRPKMGFGIPLGEWLRGPLRDWAEDLLDAARLRDDGFLDPLKVRRVWDDHVAGRANGEYALWDVLMFQAWLRSQAVTRPDVVAVEA